MSALYSVKVKLKRDFVEVDGDQIIVGIKSPPEKGRANLELIEKIARHFGVTKSSVRIVSGKTSKKKIVEVG
jgi:hypothetical protein